MSVSARGLASALGAVALLSLPEYAAADAPDGPRAFAADASRGRTLYSTYCAVCHQANGEGVAGASPPLKGSAVVNRADAAKHLDIVLGGLQGARVSGVTYANPMPAFGATLSDADIAAIVDYERRAWGNHGVLIGAAQVASERARLK